MKPIITLLASITVALLGTGCAMTETNQVRTYQLKTCEADDTGIWHNQNERLPITGRVVRFMYGELQTEFFVMNGVKHGRSRSWHVDGGKVLKGYLEHDAVYENGEIVRLRRYWFNARTPEATGHNWWNETEWQLILKGWNQDGTPAEPGKEKGINK